MILLCAPANKVSSWSTVSGYFVVRYLEDEIALSYECEYKNRRDDGLRALFDFTQNRFFISDSERNRITLTRDNIDSLICHRPDTSHIEHMGLQKELLSEYLYRNENKRMRFLREFEASIADLYEALKFSPYYKSADGKYLYKIIRITCSVTIIDKKQLNDEWRKRFISLWGDYDAYSYLNRIISFDPYAVIKDFDTWLPDYSGYDTKGGSHH